MLLLFYVGNSQINLNCSERTKFAALAPKKKQTMKKKLIRHTILPKQLDSRQHKRSFIFFRRGKGAKQTDVL